MISHIGLFSQRRGLQRWSPETDRPAGTRPVPNRNFLANGRITSVVIVFLAAHLMSRTLTGAEINFNRDVRPILAEHCFACHGPDDKNRGGDLRLDLATGGIASVLDREDPGESELLRRIDSTDGEEVMPPESANKPLSASQRQILRQWVISGAQYQGHWSFEPIQTRQPPNTDDDAVTWQPIDLFLLEKLRSAGLHFSKPSSRSQLIRRAYFDLIGLPPTWDEVVTFEQDLSPDAYAKLIDRLLDSPRYGERWGRHWLDLARYADTHGGAAIGFRSYPFSYTYRDYVIRAFNENTPYNQFLLEQIAADQLDFVERSPKLAALGFLTVGMQFRNRHDRIDDQIDVITRGLMGLTVSCARCHDHKFDPIPTKDYYSLYAALAPSSEPEQLPAIAEVSDTEAKKQYDDRLDELQVQLDDFLRDQNEIMRARLRMQVGLYLREIAKGATEQDVSTAFLSYRTDDIRPIILNRWLEYLGSMRENDPVFGPWVRLKSFANLAPAEFRAKSQELVDKLAAELAQADSKSEKQHQLGSAPPRWNPLVLEGLKTKSPTSLLEVADVYGVLFAETHQAWVTKSLQASSEAISETTVVADESPEHQIINSPVHRQLRRHLFAPGTPTAVSEELASSMLNRTIEDMLGSKREAIHQLHLTAPGSPPRAMILDEPRQVTPYHILQRGNPLSRGAQVEPGFLSALSVAMAPPQPGKRRLALALAVVAPENPLTPRVLVNWVWQHHFGQGLVHTPDDFGTRGMTPSHPELLDYLADQFVREGWSIKKLHRSIMLSMAYQQGAMEDDAARSTDPENGLLWRMPRRRLDFESMRDAMLLVSGELDLAEGGRPVDLSTEPAVPRRSVYGFVNRDVVSPLMSTFDAANPNACTAKRVETTVPQQTLFALNSVFIQDRADKLQTWVMSLTSKDLSDRIETLYKRILSRRPSPGELARAIDFLQVASGDPTRAGSDESSAGQRDSARRWSQLAHALLASNEFVFLD